MRGPPSPEAQRDNVVNGAESPGSDAGGDGGDDAAGLGLSEEASGNFKAGGFANETSTPTGGTSASDWESSSGTGTEGGPPSAPATPGRADAEPPLPDESEEPEPEPEPPLETAESVERENDELREKLASRDEELARLHARLAEVEGETQVERGPAIALPPQQRSPRSRKPLSKAQQEYNEGLYRREQELMKEKKERMEARRQQYIDAELDGCTFAPKISNKAADFTTSNATKLVLTAEEKIERQTTQIGKIVRDAIASNRSLGGKAMKNIETVFKAIDKDGSGDLDHQEFELAMNRLGLGLSALQVQQCIEVLDKDGDGEVSLEEFMSLVAKPVKAATKAISATRAFAEAGAKAGA